MIECHEDPEDKINYNKTFPVERADVLAYDCSRSWDLAENDYNSVAGKQGRERKVGGDSPDPRDKGKEGVLSAPIWEKVGEGYKRKTLCGKKGSSPTCTVALQHSFASISATAKQFFKILALERSRQRSFTVRCVIRKFQAGPNNPGTLLDFQKQV